MRTTKYLGQKLGAVTVEKRRGHVSSISIVSIDRNPPEGADWVYKLTTLREITGRATIEVLDRTLCQARRSYNGTYESLVVFDRVVAPLIA